MRDVRRNKRAVMLAELEDMRERMTLEAYQWQRVLDVRTLAPVATAYATILNFLDGQIEGLIKSLREVN